MINEENQQVTRSCERLSREAMAREGLQGAGNGRTMIPSPFLVLSSRDGCPYSDTPLLDM